MRLTDGNTRRLSGLKYKLVCSLKLVADIVRGDIKEFVYDMDGPEFLRRELVGFDVVKYQ